LLLLQPKECLTNKCIQEYISTWNNHLLTVDGSRLRTDFFRNAIELSTTLGKRSQIFFIMRDYHVDKINELNTTQGEKNMLIDSVHRVNQMY